MTCNLISVTCEQDLSVFDKTRMGKIALISVVQWLYRVISGHTRRSSACRYAQFVIGALGAAIIYTVDRPNAQ